MDAVPPAVLHAPLAPEAIHPALWRAHQLGRPGDAALATGFAALDAELPGGGWPKRVLTELLLAHPGVGEMRLLAPALAALAQGGRSAACSVMLFDPPAVPCAPALVQLGLDARQLIVVRGREDARAAAQQRAAPGRPPPGARHLSSADLFWALEQALKSGHVGAVLAWLPDRLRADALRRLQLAAQGHDGPVFLLRGIAARLKPSAAPLRLALHGAAADELSVHVLKRRGPALAQPLKLELPPVLPPALRTRAGAARASADAGVPLPVDAG
jgi:protein ImuA